MIFRQLNTLGDWTFGGGISGYAVDEGAIQLNIVTRLKSWKNDCFFAMNDFVDWQARLEKGQLTNLVNELRSVLIQSFGVVAVTSFTATLDDVMRKCTIQYNVTTIFSQSFTNTLVIGTGG
jgi:hypothetical protein